MARGTTPKPPVPNPRSDYVTAGGTWYEELPDEPQDRPVAVIFSVSDDPGGAHD
jgi:hypothetical protein